MLVEDDNSLREIYQARLMAEGYQTVAAKDGEEALSLVVQEKPDLIILDIMMPKISGFDTLDILRSTPATQSTKVIMMSALSQAEDKTRAEKLGANRYLVKSQVTLEDIVKTVKEVLGSDDPTAVASQDLTSSDIGGANITPPVQITAPVVIASEEATDNASTVISEPVSTQTSDNTPDVQDTDSTHPVDTTTPDLVMSPPEEIQVPELDPLNPTQVLSTQDNQSINQVESEINSQSDMTVNDLTPVQTVEEMTTSSNVTLPQIDSSDEVESDPNPLTSSTIGSEETGIPLNTTNPLASAESTETTAPSSAPQNEPAEETVAISGSDTIAPSLQDKTSLTMNNSLPEYEDKTPNVGGVKVIEPISDQSEDSQSRLAKLLAAEEEKEKAISDAPTTTLANEESQVETIAEAPLNPTEPPVQNTTPPTVH